MEDNLTIKDHIAVILKIKQAYKDESMFDIIMEYSDENEHFDLTAFLKELKKNQSFKEYLKKDMKYFNYGKYRKDGTQIPDEDIESFISDLF